MENEQDLDKLEDKILILIDDLITEQEQRQKLAENFSENHPKLKEKVKFLKMSWLSECLEESAFIGIENYRINPNVKKAQDTSYTTSDDPSPSTSCGTGTSSSNNKDESSKKVPYVDRVRHKFVCAQSSDNPLSTNVNKLITDELEKLAKAYKSTNDTWRAFGYQKAISAIKNYPRPITNREEAGKIPQV